MKFEDEPLADWEKELLGISTGISVNDSSFSAPSSGPKSKRSASGLPQRNKASGVEGSGRCSARSFTSLGRHQPWGNFDHGVVHPVTQEVIPVKHWKDLAKIRQSFKEEGISYDGQVASAPKGSLTKALSEGTAALQYMDESTVRGGYPLDCPPRIKDQVGSLIAEVRLSMKNLEDSEVRDLRATLAHLLREEGYPNLSKEELLRLAGTVFPVLTHIEVENGHLRKLSYAFSGKKALSIRVPLPSDATLMYAKLKEDENLYGALPSPEEFFEATAKFPMLASWDARGNLTSFQVLSPDARDGSYALYRYHSNWHYTETAAYLKDDYVNVWLTAKEASSKKLCYSCFSDGCTCFKTPADYLAALVEARSSYDRTPDREHRWGKGCAVRPSFDIHRKAVERIPEVEAELEKLFIGGAETAKERFGRTVTYNLAVFLEQSGQSADFLSLAGDEIFQEMKEARLRFEENHTKYAATLYDEFESSERTVSDRVAEVHLGRDGIYAYTARQAQLRAIRLSLSPAERKVRRAKENALKYVIASRSAPWRPEEHNPLIGDLRPVFIDTGFAGTIPEKILRARGEMSHAYTEDRPTDSVRLFSSSVREYQFKHQISHSQAVVIEHDAKPTYSTSKVNGGRPTSAFEQLIFRQLREHISEQSAQKTNEILESARKESDLPSPLPSNLPHVSFKTGKSVPEPSPATALLQKLKSFA